MVRRQQKRKPTFQLPSRTNLLQMRPIVKSELNSDIYTISINPKLIEIKSQNALPLQPIKLKKLKLA